MRPTDENSWTFLELFRAAAAHKVWVRPWQQNSWVWKRTKVCFIGCKFTFLTVCVLQMAALHSCINETGVNPQRRSQGIVLCKETKASVSCLWRQHQISRWVFRLLDSSSEAQQPFPSEFSCPATIKMNPMYLSLTAQLLPCEFPGSEYIWLAWNLIITELVL